MRPPSANALAALVFVASAGLGMRAEAQQSKPVHPATEYLSGEMKAEQTDLSRNRGMLWVDQGLEQWRQGDGATGKSCSNCHGEAEASMRGVAARYPAFDRENGRLLNLEGRINQCRTERQHASALAYESNQLLGLTAYIALQSRGMPVSVAIDGPARPFFEAGQRLWTERQGQLNLACTQCHDANAGRKLRGDTISSAVATGYPVYRLEWQGLGSLHRRLRACQLGVRAVQFDQGAPEYLALELYLASRAAGLPVETPALRR
jgi:L-cysteine S-thiosulfotransferase